MTPEEAARGDIPERFVRVVGVVERRVDVVDGCAFTWFGRVSEREAYLEGPQHVGWVHADGSETRWPRYGMSPMMRAKFEEWLVR